MKNKKIVIVPICITIIVALIVMCINRYNTNVFFLENEKAINFEVIESYIIVDKNGEYITVDKESDKYNVICDILKNSEIHHDKNNIYLLDGEIKRIIVKGKIRSNTIYFIEHNDEYVTMVFMDYSKNRSTVFMLDNHDYLVADISYEDYERIFN